MALRPNLQYVDVTGRYEAPLLAGYDELSGWAAVHRRPGPGELFRDPRAMNSLPIDFAQSRFDGGIRISRAGRTSVQHKRKELAWNPRRAWESILLLGSNLLLCVSVCLAGVHDGSHLVAGAFERTVA